MITKGTASPSNLDAAQYKLMLLSNKLELRNTDSINGEEHSNEDRRFPMNSKRIHLADWYHLIKILVSDQ